MAQKGIDAVFDLARASDAAIRRHRHDGRRRRLARRLGHDRARRRWTTSSGPAGCGEVLGHFFDVRRHPRRDGSLGAHDVAVATRISDAASMVAVAGGIRQAAARSGPCSPAACCTAFSPTSGRRKRLVGPSPGDVKPGNDPSNNKNTSRDETTRTAPCTTRKRIFSRPSPARRLSRRELMDRTGKLGIGAAAAHSLLGAGVDPGHGGRFRLEEVSRARRSSCCSTSIPMRMR